MFSFFANDSEIYTIELCVGTYKEKQQVQMPSIMSQQHFLKLIQQVAQTKGPSKVTMSRKDVVKPDKEIVNRIEFANNSWIKEFGEEQ